MSGFASVVIGINPHDEPFGPTLAAWAAQEGAGAYEVIVVDSGIRPTLRREVDLHRAAHPSTPVRVLDVDGAGRAAANNAGVRAGRGDLLVFVADDFRPGRTLVAAHRRMHAMTAAPAVGVGPGYFAAGQRGDPFRRWIEDSGTIFGIGFPLAGLDWRPGFFYVGNSSMLRSTFEAVGPFDERFRHDLFDDFEWSLRLRRLGIPTRYVPRALAWHEHDVTLEQRLAATTLLGEAVRIYEGGWQGPSPWGSLTTLEPAALEAELAQERARDGDPGPWSGRARRWQLELALAFVRGYRAA